MLIWLGFHLTIICLLFCYSNSDNDRAKNIIKWCVIITLIYFSSYRNGLGSDWNNYIRRLEIYNSLESLVLGFSEPLFSLIGFIINNTFLSPIFLFFICSIITNIGIGRFLFENEKYVIPSVLLYVFIPTLFGMSLNITRQYFAIGLFFYAIKYIDNSFLKYSVCIIGGALMHMSAILLLPLYWILNIKIPRYYVIPSIAVIVLFANFFLKSLSGMDIKYAENASSEETMSSSGMIMLYDLFFIIFLFNKKIYYSISNRNRNLFLLFIVIINMSYVNYFFYRLSYFFFPVVAFVFSFILTKLSRNQVLISSFICLLIFLNYYIFYNNISNTEIVPDKMLPVLSIFDAYYGR